MLTGDEQSKKAFGYMSHQSIRSFLCLFLRNSKEIEELVKIIPDNQITEYHLRDIFEKNNGESYETKLKSLIQRIDNFLANKKQRKDVLKKRYPKETPIKILEDLGMQSYIEKFKEHDVLESEFFYQLTEGNLKGELGVESFGLRKEFMKKITELTKKTEEEEEEMIGAVEELIVEKVQNALKKSGSIQY